MCELCNVTELKMPLFPRHRESWLPGGPGFTHSVEKISISDWLKRKAIIAGAESDAGQDLFPRGGGRQIFSMRVQAAGEQRQKAVTIARDSRVGKVLAKQV